MVQRASQAVRQNDLCPAGMRQHDHAMLGSKRVAALPCAPFCCHALSDPGMSQSEYLSIQGETANNPIAQG